MSNLKDNKMNYENLYPGLSIIDSLDRKTLSHNYQLLVLWYYRNRLKLPNITTDTEIINMYYEDLSLGLVNTDIIYLGGEFNDLEEIETQLLAHNSYI
jgi:hypothetical protein